MGMFIHGLPALCLYHWLFAVSLLRYSFNCIDDRVVTGAAAIVARKVFANLFASWYSAALEQILCRRQHARRAETALQGITPLECLLQIADFARVRHPLDRLDRSTVALCRQHQTTAHDFSIEPHGAGAAHTVLAADVAPRKK